MSLITQTSSFLCPAVPINNNNLSSAAFLHKTRQVSVPIPVKFCYDKTKFSMFSNEKSRYSRTTSIRKLSVLYNGYPYFPSLHHPLESELPEASDDGDDGGIGILEFFQGKNIFITGATGLLGKALIEKLLRSTSVGKIYLLIKAEDKDAALDRLNKEIVDSELFKCVREKHGNIYYQELVKEKLIPVVGNICEPNLGMDFNSCRAIMKDVDIIIESAASTTLNERYDLLLDLNVNAPQRLMRFAKRCKNLKLFVHISTAYVNGRKEGLILEKPLIMGENGRKEMNNDDEDEDEMSSFPGVDLADEISLAMKSTSQLSSHHHQDYDVTKNLKRLGQQRANSFGWYNAYHLTKAMGEMVLNEIREDVPLLIIRPTVIESSYNQPFPGWIQGNRMFDPVIISYGKGQLPAYLADPQLHMDIIPVDMVVNSTIAAIAKHGTNSYKPELNVYHVASGVVNPLRFCDFFDILHEYFNSTPLFNIKNNISKIKCFSNMNDLSKYTRDAILSNNEMGDAMDEKMVRKVQSKAKAKVAYAEQLCKMYEFVGFIKGRFDTSNTQKLLKEMSKEERLNFEVDATKIDWRNYFLEIHIPGLRRYVLNDTKISV